MLNRFRFYVSFSFVFQNKCERKQQFFCEKLVVKHLIFSGEALVGNEAVDQLVKFNQALADYSREDNPRLIDGIVLTKFDTIDDKVINLYIFFWQKLVLATCLLFSTMQENKTCGNPLFVSEINISQKAWLQGKKIFFKALLSTENRNNFLGNRVYNPAVRIPARFFLVICLPLT